MSVCGIIDIRRRLVAPKSRVCWVDANIGDMAEHVSLAVLHNRFAEVAANAPERESDIFVRPTVYGNATEIHKYRVALRGVNLRGLNSRRI